MTVVAEKKAISAEDFEKYGCPECSSKNCPKGPGAANATERNCGNEECGTRFVVLDQGTDVSPIAYGWDGHYPVLRPHPLALGPQPI